jgi:ferrous iron transport protein B
MDATRLERNLNLALQILEITDRAVVCLNLMDEAKRHQLEINSRSLSKELGIPVVPTSARQRLGIQELLQAIHEVALGNYICKPYRFKSGSKAIIRAIEQLARKIESNFPGLKNARWVALRLLEGDPRIITAVQNGELGSLKQVQSGVQMDESTG